jgi:hypothetical protein
MNRRFQINALNVKRNSLKDKIKLATGRVDLAVETKLCFQEKMSKNTPEWEKPKATSQKRTNKKTDESCFCNPRQSSLYVFKLI